MPFLVYERLCYAVKTAVRPLLLLLWIIWICVCACDCECDCECNCKRINTELVIHRNKTNRTTHTYTLAITIPVIPIRITCDRFVYSLLESRLSFCANVSVCIQYVFMWFYTQFFIFCYSFVLLLLLPIPFIYFFFWFFCRLDLFFVYLMTTTFVIRRGECS